MPALACAIGGSAAFADHGEALEGVWARLERGARDRRSAWHTPVVASTKDGEARARVMVLRGADRDARDLRLHTDRRAAKFSDLADHPHVELLFYDKAENLQVRARGRARVEADGPAADGAWANTRLFGRRCYMAPNAPGSESAVPASGLPAELEGREPSLVESESGRTNFAVVLVALDRLEWLHLAHTGHRRGVLEWNGGEWRGRWLLP